MKDMITVKEITQTIDDILSGDYERVKSFGVKLTAKEKVSKDTADTKIAVLKRFVFNTEKM